MKTYAVIFFGAALITILGMPLLTRLAKALGLVDKPGLRKVHASPIPRIGGVVVAFATMGMLLPVLALDNTIGAAFQKIAPGVATLLAMAALVFIVGLIDDIRGMRAAVKLVALVGAALAICCSGYRIETLSIESVFALNLGWVSWPLTVLWIVGITVGINFIDGLDGLAAGISAIVCGTIAVLAYSNGQWAMLALMLALLGSLAGFLFFNFNPAKVFLGDCGSMFLGFMIGAGSVVCMAKTSTFAGIAVSACALGVPILDTTFTMLRRGVLDRRSIFGGERGHIHHRLLDLGFGQRQVVIIIHGLTLLGAVTGLMMIGTHHFVALLILLGVLVGFFLFFHFVGAARIGETVAVIRRIRSFRQQAKKEQASFDDAQLRMRESASFEGWWAAVCRLAEELDFVWVTVAVRNDGGQSWTTVWRRPGQMPSRHDLVTLAIPASRRRTDCQMQLEAGLAVNGSLEAAGRRGALLGRLIDEHELTNLPPQVATGQGPLSTVDQAADLAVDPAVRPDPAAVNWPLPALLGQAGLTGGRLEHHDREPLLFDLWPEEKRNLPMASSQDTVLAGAVVLHAPSRPSSESAGPGTPPEPISILGVPVVPFASYEQAVDCVAARIAAGRQTVCVAVNPEKVYRAKSDPQLLDVLQKATFGLCDGIGISVAAQLLHQRKINRCTGCDFFFHLVERAARSGWGVYLLGAAPEANEQAATKLVEKYPGLRIVGRQDGYFQDSAAVVRQINASGADLVFVAMGSPKQELWIAQHSAELTAPFCMGVGGSFDVAGGLARRAPQICQKTGTEFLFQLATRPGWKPAVKWNRTLARLRFLLIVIRVALSDRREQPARRPEHLQESAAGTGFLQKSAATAAGAEPEADLRGREV
jgi:exopolysaccharide biosynthesis WecB/TagA/CpsF family protein